MDITDIGKLRYHSTPTPISEYQYSDIDSDIGGHTSDITAPLMSESISEYWYSDIGVGVL